MTKTTKVECCGFCNHIELGKPFTCKNPACPYCHQKEDGGEKCHHEPNMELNWGIDEGGSWNICKKCSQKYYFKPNFHELSSTPDTIEEWEKRFDEMFVTVQNGQRVIGYNANLQPSPEEVKKFIRTEITKAEERGRKKEREHFNSLRYGEKVMAEIEEARADERRKVAEEIDEYFKGLVMIPDPQVTKENLKKYITHETKN